MPHLHFSTDRTPINALLLLFTFYFYFLLILLVSTSAGLYELLANYLTYNIFSRFSRKSIPKSRGHHNVVFVEDVVAAGVVLDVSEASGMLEDVVVVVVVTAAVSRSPACYVRLLLAAPWNSLPGPVEVRMARTVYISSCVGRVRCIRASLVKGIWSPRLGVIRGCGTNGHERHSSRLDCRLDVGCVTEGRSSRRSLHGRGRRSSILPSAIGKYLSGSMDICDTVPHIVVVRGHRARVAVDIEVGLECVLVNFSKPVLQLRQLYSREGVGVILEACYLCCCSREPS